MKFQCFHDVDFFGPGRDAGRIAGPEAGRGPRCSYADLDAIRDQDRPEAWRTGGPEATATAGPGS